MEVGSAGGGTKFALPRGRRGAYRMKVLPICVFSLLGSFLVASAGAQPQSVADPPGRESAATGYDDHFVGCGKARAALRGFLSEPEAIPDAAYLETLSDTDVLHYDLDIEITNINPSLNRCTISGTNTITIGSLSPALTEFNFRLRSQFLVSSAMINGAIPATVEQVSTSTRRVILDRAYGMNEVFTLTITYTGNTVSAAFGSIEVDTQPGSSTPVVATLSEPYYAYTWWPVKDGDLGLPGDNSDKSTIDIAVTAPSAYQVVSNGLLESVDVLGGSRARYRWSSDYPIATYLVSFSATTYNTWTQSFVYDGGSMPVAFYIYPTYDYPLNRSAWEKVLGMLSVFGSLYGPYPFLGEKYGLYNFPFGGGMEHQTISGQGGFGESLSAHELAHQWWGDAITCKTWCDIWLNEGFATYSECLWSEFKGGSSDFSAYRSCMLSHKPSSVGGSVYVYPEDTDNVYRIFDGNLSYRKGAWVLHQLRGVVGSQEFFDILAAYRAAYEHGAPSTEEFIAVASDAYGSDLSWFFEQWVYEIGAPAYQYGWSTTTVDGQPYLLFYIAQVQTPSYPEVFEMPVPLALTSGSGTTQLTVWNDARTQWFVLPIDEAPGTVSFDPDQWILRTSASNVGYVAGPPTLLKVTPTPGVHETDSPITGMTFSFHVPVDVPPGAISVVGDFSGAAPFVITSPNGVHTVDLIFDAPLIPDVYTVTVGDGITATSSGIPLDGELSAPVGDGSFPSGDGVPGGAAVFRLGVKPAIPATSTWGLVIVALAVLTGGCILLRRRSCFVERGPTDLHFSK